MVGKSGGWTAGVRAQSLTISQQESEAGRMVGTKHPDIGMEIVGHGMLRRLRTAGKYTHFSLRDANHAPGKPLIKLTKSPVFFCLRSPLSGATRAPQAIFLANVSS